MRLLRNDRIVEKRNYYMNIFIEGRIEIVDLEIENILILLPKFDGQNFFLKIWYLNLVWH